MTDKALEAELHALWKEGGHRGAMHDDDDIEAELRALNDDDGGVGGVYLKSLLLITRLVKLLIIWSFMKDDNRASGMCYLELM